MSARVLLVDDSSVVLDGLARLLVRDFDVDVAQDADEALDKLTTERPFAVVVSDYQLPGRSGLELLEEVRRRAPQTQRVLMTAHADLDLSLRATNDCEVLRFLVKPVHADAIRAALAEGVSRYAAVVAERELDHELERARASMNSLVGALADPEAAEHGSWMRVVTRLASRVARGAAIDEVARSSASALHELLGRGLRLDLHADEVEGAAGTLSICEGDGAGDDPARVPVVIADGLAGELLGGPSPGGERLLSPDERVLAEVVAELAGLGVSEHLRRCEVADAQDATIFALARLAATRDNETGEHLVRVGRYCELVTRALAGRPRDAEVIDEAFVRDVARSAPLHDIGKVGIPDSILLKPGPLDDDEWVIMRTHAEIGADILGGVIEHVQHPGYLLVALDVAWCHHERWDGSGYPRGLSGEEIPLAARILAVADCFDALVSRRSYKEPWEPELAFEYVEEHAGSRYDPLVVEVFLENRDLILEILQAYPDRRVEAAVGS